MKQKHNGGFSLIETVVAIAILGLIVVPCCSGLLMSIRINEKAQQMMQAQLAVSSAVETLMAEGIDRTIAGVTDSLDEAGFLNYDAFKVVFLTEESGEKNPEAHADNVDDYPGVHIKVKLASDGSYCTVKVKDDAGLVEVTTSIRVVETPRPELQGGADT